MLLGSAWVVLWGDWNLIETRLGLQCQTPAFPLDDVQNSEFIVDFLLVGDRPRVGG